MYKNLSLFGRKVELADTSQVKLKNVLDIYPKHFFNFVNVGANDGVGNDPLYEYIKSGRASGILVEPIPSAFKDLINNYKSLKGVVFENVAITDSGEKQSIMYMKKSSSVASLNKNHKPIGGKSSGTVVDSCSINDIFSKYAITSLDVLSIDAEGYDYNIIKSIDFDICCPNVIHYEHRHLENCKVECEKLLMSLNYGLFFNKNNTVAIRREDVL